MGNGKRLKEILAAQGKSVRWLSRETDIRPTTLYTIIQNDTAIRYDFALKISLALNIEPSEICSDPMLHTKNIDLDKHRKDNEAKVDYVFWGNRIEDYIKDSMTPFLELIGVNNIREYDTLIRNYYQLTDEGRKDVEDLIRILLMTKKDPERSKEIKKINKW